MKKRVKIIKSMQPVLRPGGIAVRRAWLESMAAAVGKNAPGATKGSNEW